VALASADRGSSTRRRSARPAAASRFRPAFQLVESKITPPKVRDGTVERPRLLATLRAEPGSNVVALIAPPGYGKTTLLADWIARQSASVLWLTVDDLDNDPANLLSYLAAGLDRISPLDPGMDAALAAPRERILATTVPRLAAEFHRLRRPCLLVLDDVHRLVDRTALDALFSLIEHLPPTVRVAIAGRARPDVRLARLRVRRDLLEIGQRLLALDDAETAALGAVAGHPLEEGEARALRERTDGWPAAVYLALLAGERDDGHIAPVFGEEGYISAYLRSEFESDLEDEDVLLLTRTAVLDAIPPQLAGAISGVAGAADRFRSLAHRSLLIEEMAGTAISYRCHKLLRDYLLTELERREPGAGNVLHRRAAAWYAATGNTDRAVEHAISGGDASGAAALVKAATLSTLYGGHATILERWLESFEDADFGRDAPLAVLAGWIHLLNGQPAAADRMADIAERSSYAGDPGDGTASFESGRAMLRAVMSRHGPRDMLANAELAVRQEPRESPWRTNALWLLGSAQWLLGNDEAADAALAAAIAAGGSAGATAALASRASLAMARGDWRAADAYAAEGRARLVQEQREEQLAALSVYAAAARVAIHTGDLVRGQEDLVRAQRVRPLASHVAPWFSVEALLELSKAYLAISDPAGAQVVVREAEQIVRVRPALGILNDRLLESRRQLAGAASTLAGSSTLTVGELRVLAFLPTYLTFNDIADRLMVSRNTIKTHAMNIYGKLWVSSRGEAVERAIELGLLEPYPILSPGHVSSSAG
jgi:LuxR family transcriptional regulator, maltose regulon positive regulatory protein